jgi:hypothetical protein
MHNATIPFLLLRHEQLEQDIHFDALAACSRELRNDTFSKEQCLRERSNGAMGMLHHKSVMAMRLARVTGNRSLIDSASPSSVTLPLAGLWGLCDWKFNAIKQHCAIPSVSDALLGVFPLIPHLRPSDSQFTLIMIALSLLSLILATTALAAPSAPSRRDSTFHGACPVPASAVVLPSGLDPLPSAPTLVLLGVGVQNYTCNSNGTFE